MVLTAWESLRQALSPVEERPRLAPGLEWARYTTRAGTPYVVVHNPATQAYARLDPREFDLLELMDGEHTVKALVIAYYQRHGTLALARVAALVGLLRRQGFFSPAVSDAYAELSTRLRGRSLAEVAELTLPRFDSVLAAWYRRWGHLFFHRVWLWLGLLAALVGPLVVLLELQRGRYALYQSAGAPLPTLLLLVVLALATLAVHELGHGLAVKHAGRTVNRAGVRLYFGLPTAFVDTSDVWMASPRHRLLTAFAGPWTGLVLGAVCALAGSLLPQGPLGALCFTAGFVLLLDNVFNFNPLLELDGYYMLVDLLDKPLLRPRALAFVRGPLWRKLARGAALTSEERLFGLFGLAAVAYGLVTVVLAVRAWQALAAPLIEAVGQAEGSLARLGLLLVWRRSWRHLR
ncbi:MAG: M50 family metallopeptidase [Chloroflexota bacterium]|nr:M50 family metallopeptidase [Chloroflexota bacterium]